MYKPKLLKNQSGHYRFSCRDCPGFKDTCSSMQDCFRSVLELLAEAEEEIKKLNNALTIMRCLNDMNLDTIHHIMELIAEK